MLHLHNQNPRKVRPGPLLVELVRLFLLDPVVPRDMKSLTIVGLQIRIGRLSAKVRKITHEMIVKNCQRIMRFLVLVKSLRH